MSKNEITVTHGVNEMTLGQKLKGYTRTPGSMLVMLLVLLAAIVTFSVLIFLIIYILVNGVPYIKAIPVLT